MSIIKKIGNKKVVLADKGVRDHNFLFGRDSYGAHPISAILGLNDKLTNIDRDLLSKSNSINNITRSLNNIDFTTTATTFTYTDKNDVSTTVKVVEDINSNTLSRSGGLLSAIAISNGSKTVTPSNISTIEGDISNLSNSLDLVNQSLLNKIELSDVVSDQATSVVRIYQENNVNVVDVKNTNIPDSQAIRLLTSNDSQQLGQNISSAETRANSYTDTSINTLNTNLSARIDAIDNQGGYLPSYNFGSSVTQSALTNYALQELNINDPLQLQHLLKVKNEYDNNVWVLNKSNNAVTWTNIGTDNIQVASVNTYGVIKGSSDDYEGSVDSLGHLSINGLSEKLSDLTQEISGINNILTSGNELVIRSYNTHNNIKFPGLTASNISDIYTNFMNLGQAKFAFVDPDNSSNCKVQITNAWKSSDNKKINLTFILDKDSESYIVKYSLNVITSNIQITSSKILFS